MLDQLPKQRILLSKSSLDSPYGAIEVFVLASSRRRHRTVVVRQYDNDEQSGRFWQNEINREYWLSIKDQVLLNPDCTSKDTRVIGRPKQLLYITPECWKKIQSCLDNHFRTKDSHPQ